MDKVLFRNVILSDPEGPHHGRKADVLAEGGKIISVSDAGATGPSGDEKVVEGGYLSPGWVDMRTHLTDPGFEWKEDLDSLAQAAISGGFTRVVTMPNTQPAIDNSGLVKSIRLRAEALPVHILPAGALSEGSRGKDLAELYDMHSSGAVAFTDGIHPIASAGLLLRGLQYLKPFDGVLMNMPLEGSLAPNAEIAESDSSMRMGMKGIPAIAEEMMLERDLKLHAYFPHRLHIGPITTAGAVDILRQVKANHPQLSVETSALYLLLDDSENNRFHSYTKVFPPLREKASVEALRKAVADGTIDVVSTSHHPQSIEEKKHDFPNAEFGASTIETAFAAAWTGLKESGVPLDRLVACVTSAPRRILKLDSQTIEVGQSAELTHFDADRPWTVEKKHLRSKSKNNPLLGRELLGCALHVMVRGRLHDSRR